MQRNEMKQQNQERKKNRYFLAHTDIVKERHRMNKKQENCPQNNMIYECIIILKLNHIDIVKRHLLLYISSKVSHFISFKCLTAKFRLSNNKKQINKIKKFIRIEIGPNHELYYIFCSSLSLYSFYFILFLFADDIYSAWTVFCIYSLLILLFSPSQKQQQKNNKKIEIICKKRCVFFHTAFDTILFNMNKLLK